LLGFIAVPDALKLIDTPATVITTVAPWLRDVVIKPDLHVQGDPKARYTLVEFADYLCPHCKEASEKIPSILEGHPEVKLIYRSYPLGWPRLKFPHSDKASVTAEAAALQGKFWPMHDFLFAHQNEMTNLSFTDDRFVNFASAIGLDIAKFQRDFADPKLLARVVQDHDDGDRAGMEMTPTFFFVTPDRVTRFVGTKDLEQIMNDPKHDAWK
jgi:protein-disulfide isomerase